MASTEERARVPEVDFEVKERAMDEAPVGITISDPSLPDNPIVYANEAFERITGYAVEEVLGRNCRFLQGEGTDPGKVAAMRESIEADEPVTVELRNYRRDGTEFWNEITIAPLRNEAGEVTHYVGFQMDVTDRKRAELAVERERENLTRLVERINGLLGVVTESVVGAVSRDEIDTALCERVVEAEPYVAAWIGEPDLARDVITVRTAAGDIDTEGFELGLGGPDPAARAIEERSSQVVEDLTAGGLADGHAIRLGDAGSMAAIPLVYRETVHGVLVVYAEAASAIDERERVVLETLGRAAGTAMNALETKRVLVADSVLEVEFAVDDPELFAVGIAREADCVLEYAGSAYRPDGSPLLFFTVEGATPEEITAAAELQPGLRDAALLTGRDGASLFEFAAAEDSIVSLLAEQGGETRSIVADVDGARLSVTFPSGTDVRAVRERLRERYPDTELVAYGERERPPETKREYIDTLEEQLTERQFTALQKAFVGGYFDRPRRITGDELADSMDITRSTFHQHLRAAQRKLLGEFFDRVG